MTRSTVCNYFGMNDGGSECTVVSSSQLLLERFEQLLSMRTCVVNAAFVTLEETEICPNSHFLDNKQSLRYATLIFLKWDSSLWDSYWYTAE